MLAITSTRFDRDYKKLDPLLQYRVNKAINILIGDPRRPGLRIYRVETYNSPWRYSWTYARPAALRDHQIQLEPRVSRSAAR